MWLCLSDSFYSVVRTKDLPEGHLLVRARREGDIQKLWPDATVKRTPGRDYLYRAAIPAADVSAAIANAVTGINYGNFKDSVADHELHGAYFDVWRAMGKIQSPPPYHRG